LAVTAAFPFSVNVHVLVLFPPLEQAPDQIASRPFDTLSVIDVPVLNTADPVLPTGTLIPTGLDVTRSPLRPAAVTDNAAVVGCPAGFTVSVVVRVTPLYTAEIVTGVAPATADVVAVNVALVAPAATVTLAGTVPAAVLLLESDARAPPAGAADVSVTVPVDELPPTTLDGLRATDDSAGAAGADCGVKRRVEENDPNTPAAFLARTRHHSCRAGRPLSVACDAVTVGFATNGAAIVDELSTCTS
jgi:hypothetical protein